MNRSHLKGSDDDAIHAVLCAADYSIGWLVRMILKKGIRLYFSLIQLLGLSRLFTRKATANPEDRFTAAQIHLLVTS
jgi:IS5 family transposase